MQPTNPLLKQFATLPLPALEGMLDSESLYVASENTLVVAVTYWLQSQEEMQQHVTATQRLRLAFKLRLLHCSSFYLAAIFGNEEHWLTKVLSARQHSLLTAASANKEYPVALKSNLTSSKSLFFSSEAAAEAAEAQVGAEVAWWKEKRSRGPGRDKNLELKLQVSLQTLWQQQQLLEESEGAWIEGETHFYCGYRWRLLTKLLRSNSSRYTHRYGWSPEYTIGLSLQCTDAGWALPLAATCSVAAVKQLPTKTGSTLSRRHAFQDKLSFSGQWIVADFFGVRFRDLAEAEEKLQHYLPAGAGSNFCFTGTVGGIL
jgi:hypothetical protein